MSPDSQAREHTNLKSFRLFCRTENLSLTKTLLLLQDTLKVRFNPWHLNQWHSRCESDLSQPVWPSNLHTTSWWQFKISLPAELLLLCLFFWSSFLDPALASGQNIWASRADACFFNLHCSLLLFRIISPVDEEVSCMTIKVLILHTENTLIHVTSGEKNM